MHQHTKHHAVMVCLFLSVTTLAAAVEQHAAIITSDLPGHSPALIAALTEALTAQAYDVSRIPIEQLLAIDGLTKRPPDLLVLPNASAMPTLVVPAIERYLRTGGDLVALRAPLGLRAPIRIDGNWVDKDAYLTAQATSSLPSVLFDLSDGLKSWSRQTNHHKNTITIEPIADQPGPGQHAVQIKLSDLSGWDTLRAPAGTSLFPASHSMVMLTAKGSNRTKKLCIEYQEKDGSRWIAVISLTNDWKRYVLSPSDFKYWTSVPNRGKPGDVFNPANAIMMQLGLAHSHTGPTDGPQDYWIGPIGTAAATPDLESLANNIELPTLDTLCPSYKLFDCHNVTKLTMDGSFAATTPLQQLNFPLAVTVRSPHPRASAAGFDKVRPWRFQPLIQANTANGEWRGNPATLLFNSDGPYKGGIWASFGVDDEAWYESPAARALLSHVIERMQSKIAILDGGTDKYTYFDGQRIRMGARLMNLGKQPKQATVHVRLFDGSTHAVHEKTWDVTLKAGDVTTYSDDYHVKNWPASGFRCEVTLVHDEKNIDRVTNDAYLWQPKKNKHFIAVQKGQFVLDGKRWRPHGINYMPSSGIGVEDWGYFGNWTSPQAYDPMVIDRDLRKIRELGYNAVSVFTYHNDIASQNAVDLLRRCEALGLKANLSLRPCAVMDFQWPIVKEMIEGLRLAENDTVFAYDLDWEPLFWGHDARLRWDRDWEAWIVEQYGSVENAETDWQFAAPRDSTGKLTNPMQKHIVDDGPWRRMVAAYRRFLDTLLYHKYSVARRLVRGIDPHHMVSFRMSEAGDPTCRWGDIIPYDFPYLVRAVDILEPEAYGRLGDWEKVKPGWFVREYARWADPGTPMIWAEIGMHIWDQESMSNTPELLAKQADFYRDFYRMLIASCADGIFSWWYPGGYRCGEKSDYGIINPDGSDRPVTEVIRKMGQQFIEGPTLRPVDTWIEFDRDVSATGIVGAYDSIQKAFWKAIDDGHTPGLRTAGTGTTSANCPPLAVGNTPLNGKNPPKYLDAAFDLVEIQVADGQWQPVSKDAKVDVVRNSSIHVRVSITNLGEATWLSLANSSQGRVTLQQTHAELTEITPLPHDVQTGGELTEFQLASPIQVLDSPLQIRLRLSVAGRGDFGERYSFILAPTH